MAKKDEIKANKKSKLLGISCSVSLVLLSVFVLAGNSIVSQQQQVFYKFANVEQGFSIESQIHEIIGQAHNMLVVAYRYNDTNYTQQVYRLVTTLQGRINVATHNNDTITSLSTLTQELLQSMRVLNENSDILNMSADDMALFDGIIANVTSAHNIIRHSDFNSTVYEFNSWFDSAIMVPARLIMAVRGIEPISQWEER